jgi:hypothetical protein
VRLNRLSSFWLPPVPVSLVVMSIACIVQFRQLGSLYAYEGGLGWRYGGTIPTIVSLIAIAVLTQGVLRIKRSEVSLIALLMIILVVVPAVAVALHSYSLSASIVLKNSLLICLGLGFFIFAMQATLKLLVTDGEFSQNIPKGNNPFVVKVLATASCLGSLYVYGVPTSLPSIFSVYDVRLTARTSAAQSPLLAYLTSWLVPVLIPLLVLVWVENRDKVAMFLTFAASLIVFASVGAKTALLTPLLLLGVSKLDTQKEIKRARRGIAAGASVVSLCGLLPIVGSFFSIVIVRRLFLIPAQIQGRFVQFFTVNPSAGFGSNGIGSFIYSGPYGASAAEVVGKQYFSAQTSANTNFVTDSFGSFGVTGVILGCCLGGILVGALSSVLPAKTSGGRLMLLFATASILSSASLLTALLTHGLLLFPLVGVLHRPSLRQSSRLVPADA